MIAAKKLISAARAVSVSLVSLVSLVSSVSLVSLSLAPTLAFAEEPSSKGIAVIHTNDVHCGYLADEDSFGYPELAAYKARLEEEGWDVILADAGDFSQGDVIGTLSDGKYPVELMNETGYDLAVLGNHEFDYGMDKLDELRELADFPLLSGNFIDARSGEHLFDGEWIADDLSVGFICVTTPKTLASSNPAHFRDETGQIVYSFMGGDDGKELYGLVQKHADHMKELGVEHVMVIGHLGIKTDHEPYTSYSVIANTSGIEVFIDADSHTVIDGERVKNKDGKDVILTQAGYKMMDIGTVFITKDGVSSKLVSPEGFSVTTDESSAEYLAYLRVSQKCGKMTGELDAYITTVVGRTEFDLMGMQGADKISRVRETNMGDLVADALKAVSDSDTAIINGGGIRADIPKGDITYGQLISVQPFGNRICKAEVTGQMILDALETGARIMPDPSGGFLQVSGITYEIHHYIPSSVKFDENGMFTGVDGEYRVKNVLINGEPLDPGKTYTIATIAYLIKDGGDGMTMFRGCTLLQDEYILDNQALIEYMSDYLDGVVGAEYSNAGGNGRIKLFAEAPADDGAASQDSAPAVPDGKDDKAPDTGAGSTAAVIGLAACALVVMKLSGAKR